MKCGVGDVDKESKRKKKRRRVRRKHRKEEHIRRQFVSYYSYLYSIFPLCTRQKTVQKGHRTVRER